MLTTSTRRVHLTQPMTLLLRLTRAPFCKPASTAAAAERVARRAYYLYGCNSGRGPIGDPAHAVCLDACCVIFVDSGCACCTEARCDVRIYSSRSATPTCAPPPTVVLPQVLASTVVQSAAFPVDLDDNSINTLMKQLSSALLKSIR